MPSRFSLLRRAGRVSPGLALAAALALAACRTTGGAPVLAEARDLAPYRLRDFPDAAYWTHRPDGAPTLVSAHRGQPELDGVPENSLRGIRELTRRGDFVIELDVAISRDGVLFLFHDRDLSRLTVHRGAPGQRAWSDLDTMRLRDDRGRLTGETIPTLAEALVSAKGRALLTLDRKAGVPYARIAAAVEAAGMEESAALILYDLDDYSEWAGLPRLGPISHQADDLTTLEQLAQRNRELYPRLGYAAFRAPGATPAAGFVGVGPPDPAILARAATLRLPAIVGTFGTLDSLAAANDEETYRDLRARGASVIATDRPLAAYRALRPSAGEAASERR